MNEEIQNKNEIVDIPCDKVTSICINDIKPNTMMIIHVNAPTQVQKIKFYETLQSLLSPFKEILKEKKVTVVVMGITETIEMIPEDQMNNAGWFKKEASLIINPYNK